MGIGSRSWNTPTQSLLRVAARISQLSVSLFYPSLWCFVMLVHVQEQTVLFHM